MRDLTGHKRRKGCELVDGLILFRKGTRTEDDDYSYPRSIYLNSKIIIVIVTHLYIVVIFDIKYYFTEKRIVTGVDDDIKPRNKGF